jgi:hypothetical protein
MRAFLGWGRPLYDEELSVRLLKAKGVADPPHDVVCEVAKRLRRQTLAIRASSLIAAVLLLVIIWKAIS